MIKRILIIGPDIKWGLGGVTIHVRRLLDYLDNDGIEYEFKDYKSNNLWTLILAINKSDIIHLHVSNPVYQLILIIVCWMMRKTVLMTLHGNYGRFNKVKNWMVRQAVRMATVPVVINEKSYEVCIKFNKNTKLIPAFIPPKQEEALPKEVINRLEKFRQQGKLIFATNASNVTVDKYGQDIYGIDFLVQYFKNSKDKVLVISDPSGNYKNKYSKLESRSVFFINYPHSYYEVLKIVDFSIRNTSTDGDALSVKESLYLGVPTLCTDVVDRPKGVRLFKYSDRNSFESCLHVSKTESAAIINGAERIVNVYMSLGK